MSDALMILPAVTPQQQPAAAPTPCAKAMTEPCAVKVEGAMPAAECATDTESAEVAAEFSEVLACVVSGLMPLPKQNVELPIEIPAESLVPAEEIESSRSLSLWNLVPTVPEEAETAEVPVTDAQADEFASEAMRALNSTKETVDISLISKNGITQETIVKETPEIAGKMAPETAPGKTVETTTKVETPVQPAVGKAPVMEKAPADGKAPVPEQKTATINVISDSETDVNVSEVARPPQSVDPSEIKLPREAKIVADTTITPVAPKQTAVSSERIVEATAAQTQDESVKNAETTVKTARAEHVRAVVQANAASTNEAKVAAKVADEMTVGPFGTLRPETSAPARSVSGRQALPDEKAEIVGKDFTEAQRAISSPATETRPVESIESSSEPKAATASPARQVSEAVQTAQRSGVRVLEMELKPEGMGTLRLKLTGPVRANSTDGQHIEIQALNPKAHALLLENMSELRSALGQWEIRLMPPVMTQDFSGVMAGSEGRGYAQSGSQRQNSQEQPGRNEQQEQTDESFAEQFGSSMNG